MNPPETPAPDGTRAARLAQRAFPLAVLVLVVVHGTLRLGAFVASHSAGWAPLAAAALGLALVVILGAGVRARASAFELAVGALAWCIGAAIVCQLSPYPTALRWGSGPIQAPVYFVLTLASGLYAVGWPRALARPSAEHLRACLLLLVWTTADGRMVERPREPVIPLLAVGALLVLGVHARLRSREWLAGPGRPLVAVLGGLLAWWAVATFMGDSLRIGITSLGYLTTGVLLAWALAGSLDERGAHRAVVGLVVGLLASLALLIVSVLELLPYNDLSRVLGSRLRLFDTYPNQVAPLFACGACLLIPLARGRLREPTAIGLPRWLVLLTLAGCIGGLLWTRSRGGLAAFLAGALVALAASGAHLPRRPARVGVALAVLLTLGVGLFLSPLGSGVREELDRRTLGQSAIGQRYHYWRSAAAAVAEHPTFGVGPAQYYAHARYAQPSFYDGSFQEVHPHSLLFAVAESAGLPGLILFLLFVAGLLELGRRRVLGARSPPERRLWAGLLGAVCACLAANLFDMTTSAIMIPLLLWCGLGLFAAGSGSAAPSADRPLRSPFACALAALLLVPLAVMPLAGQTAATWGDVLLDRGSNWRAGQLFHVAGLVQPWSARAARGELVVSQRMGHSDRVLVLTEAETRATPSRMDPWMQYGRLLLQLGRPEDAVPVLEHARPMDPRGPRTGELVMLRAWAQLELGNEAEARALLVEGMSTPGADWAPLPQEIMPAQPGDPAGAARIGFRLGGDPEHLVPFDDVLEEFGRLVMAEAEVNYVMARRKLSRLAAGYVAQGRPAVALEFVRRYSQLLEPMASIQVLEIELLGQLGDFAGAAEAYHGSPYIDHPYMTEAYLRSTRDSPDPEQQREFMELPLDITSGGFTDIFFSAANSAPVYALESERALVRGDWAGALHFNRRALYHLNTTGTRVRQAARFFVRAAELEAPDDVLLDAFETLSREVARQPVVNRVPELMRAWDETLREAWDGEHGPLPSRLP